MQSVSEDKAVQLAISCTRCVGCVIEHSKFALFNFFNITPSTFNSLDFSPPCIYALLPNKTEHTYKKLLKRLSAITENTEPHRILLNIERAALNAFASHHTGALLKSCYFPFCQVFKWKINKVGLKRLYETNHDLNLLRLISALTFVPVEMVNAAFDLVFEEIEKVSDKIDLDGNIFEKPDEETSYFQRTYIKGETIGRNSHDHRFPVSLWNHSEEAAAG